ncbi:MAG TPA: hypothetical protein VFY79_12775 [Dehalococcoidia bacterium]|nr:hypothetical protein [Dehalococcoidia bacterium]
MRPAWRSLRRAISLARDVGDGIGQACATVGILRIWGPPDKQREMADEALDALGDRDPHLRALLLLRSGRWSEAFVIAEARGFDDILQARKQDEAWEAIEAGRVDEFRSVMHGAHETLATLSDPDVAAGPLRALGFRLLQIGQLREGLRTLNETVAYARAHHLRFQEQLALIDVIGIAFAQNEIEECERLLGDLSGGVDFRADLYRMWIAQQRRDIDEALRLLVEPAAGGGALTALSQIHCAAAGMFFIAGREELATRELEEWAAVAREGVSFAEEAPVATDCLVALGSEDLVREVRDAIARRDAESALPDRYCTLQGRSLDVARGALALRFGELDEARRHFETGLRWARDQRCPVDAGRCVRGLAEVAMVAGQVEDAQSGFEAAAIVFEAAGAAYEHERTRRLATDRPE